jgi:hypothetical protein
MTRANTSAAVKAQRAPGQVEADDALTALYRKLEFFPTPPWAGRAGGELIRFLDPEARDAAEPACGRGHMAEPLREYFAPVYASDIHDHGYGPAVRLDFLDDGHPYPEVDWIVSNPPFRLAGDFVRRGLRCARRGVAMLLRLQFLEGGGRYGLLYGSEPMTVCAVFAERVSMTLGCWDPEAGLPTAYAWFVWMKQPSPSGYGSQGATLMGIPPGTRRRLTRPDDAARFGVRREAGLLDAMGAAE